MRSLRGALSFLPAIPAIAGIPLSVWRFRADDGFGGLAFCLAGMLLTIVVAVRSSGPDRRA